MSDTNIRERLLSVADVAEYLGVSVRTVWGLRAEGNFAPGTRIGRRVVWRESVLTAWLEEATEAPGESAVYKFRSVG
ncbi:helix-turn-helix transcriptional regulator [Intrasporangium calvum]|uniref:helix-turn-helix transcriptional regulator n=1 Tax=Intrasporangium calvum TaxID=53358 RepID=UPI000DF5EB95|nr:helix-turn-helix domain-containing protein [Intrasporangium calvum]AXG12289.1 DNA-binding protein [Intrasporangium calvum]